MKEIIECEQAQLVLITALESDDFSEHVLEEIKQGFPKCSDQIQAQYDLWLSLRHIEVPIPSDAMDAGFYRSLSMVSNSSDRSSGITRFVHRLDKLVMHWSSAARWSGVAALFMIGLLAGKFFWSPGQGSIKADLVLDQNQDDATHFVVYDVNANAADRLKEVQQVKSESKGNQRIYDALNNALLNDKNVNVRLSALESLVHFADDPQVRKYLIEAIPRQTSPLVQVALADAMLLLHEKGSKDAWEQLLQSDQVQMDVRHYVEESLDKLY